ncbi:hypothetical protein MKEN_00828700 [Mycena kentingensis (nom. inval.)]|nr:hypothetical protein MKEN_00828700 [Mycena kentingensis (nom. inval.)]
MDTGPLEMETVDSAGFHRSVSRSRSRLRAVSKLRATRDYAIGIGLLLIVVILWTASNFITQGMYNGGFEKPFLTTYLNTAAFALYLIPLWAKRRWRERNGADRDRAAYQPLAVDAVTPTFPEEVIDETLPPLTTRETARLALVFCLVWFVANWTLNASLDFTSVSSATILSSTSGFFTLGIGRIFRVESFTLLKTVAVATSFTGVLLVSLSDSVAPVPKQPAGAASRPLAHTEDLAPKPIFGDALALISALFYALYVILLKVRIRSESRIDMQEFFGYVGVFNILLLWPVAVLLHVTGIEPFELPPRDAAAALLVNMGITLSSDFIYVIAMLKTSPIVCTVGLSLTIPFSVLVDFLLSNFTRGQVIFGALLVLLSFVVVGLDNDKVHAQEDIIEEGSEIDPKAPRNPVRLAKRSFAVQDNAVEHVQVGEQVATSADDVLRSMDVDIAPALKKKEKQQIKRDALRQRLETSTSPYSKSHQRRLKRKEREQLAGNTMNDLQDALESQPKKKVKLKPGQIGEGKNATLSQAQRQKALQTERLRHPQILNNSDFTKNPFETIRLHAQNTLLKHSA